MKLARFFIFLLFCFPLAVFAEVWTIAIDPGHGGKDPGTIGRNLGIYEKNVTLDIARQLKALLAKDPHFKPVMLRDRDIFIPVPERSEIARKYKADFLISIHADSGPNPERRGASVWVLSNRRAKDEMGQWLEDSEKRSELLGGVGQVLSTTHDKYFDQTVLDLQFAYSQRAAYQLGNQILRHFAKAAKLSHNVPQHASLGVLRAPDIPSVLVETGFLSNKDEEQKLSTTAYRNRIATMIYEGLVAFRQDNLKSIQPNKAKAESKTVANSSKSTPKEANNSSKISEIKDSNIRHKVKNGETLGGLAIKYGVKSAEIVGLNQLKRTHLIIGETLKIPSSSRQMTAEKSADEKHREKSAPLKSANAPQATKNNAPVEHLVKANDTLSGIAAKYQLSLKQLRKLNPQLKNDNVIVGQKIKLK